MDHPVRANPPKLRVVIVIAALVGIAMWHRFLGYFTFVVLIFVDLLSTPLLWGLSSILRWCRVRTAVAQRVLFIPFLSLCAFLFWGMNPYQREQGNLRNVFGEQVPRDLKVEDVREEFGKEFGTFKAWIKCDPIALEKSLKSGIFEREDLSDPARIDGYPVFPSPAQTRVPKDEWLLFKRTTWPKSDSVQLRNAWIITDPTFSWAFVSFVG